MVPARGAAPHGFFQVYDDALSKHYSQRLQLELKT
jgi:hypothetical protein